MNCEICDKDSYLVPFFHPHLVCVECASLLMLVPLPKEDEIFVVKPVIPIPAIPPIVNEPFIEKSVTVKHTIKKPYYRKDGIKYSTRRKRRILANGGSHTKEEWQVLMSLYANKCVICGSTERITKDHIIPISKGGSDDISNIQPMCWSCNKKKNNR